MMEAVASLRKAPRADAIAAVLREAGAPLRCCEIAEWLGARGHRLPGARNCQQAAVRNILARRDDLFAQLEGWRGTWVLVE